MIEEFPKWIVPHKVHVKQDSLGNVAVYNFSEFHINRVNKEVTVLVLNSDEESFALTGEKAASEEVEQ